MRNDEILDEYIHCIYTRFVIVCVRPVPVEVDDVGMLELREALEHLSDLVLLSLVVLPFRELHLVPHHLHALFRVHGQVRAVDPGHVPLLHLMEMLNVIISTIIHAIFRWWFAKK